MTEPSELRRLGRSSVQVSAMGLGSAPVAGLFAPVSEPQAAATIVRALELSIRYIDAAPAYGLGLAERRVGDSLRRVRLPAVLSTKVGRLIVPDPTADTGMFKGAPGGRAVFDFSAAGVMRSLEESLVRLGLERIDILYIHDPDDHAEVAMSQAYPALARLRASGVVGCIGVGMNQAELLTRFVCETDIDCVLVAGRYSLLDQTASAELLSACLARGVAVVVGGVYNSGILASSLLGHGTGGLAAGAASARPEPTYDYLPAAPGMVARARRMAAVCAAHGVPLKAAALQFPLAHPAVTSVVVGARSPAEVEENAALMTHPIPGALWEELRSACLIPVDAPATSAASPGSASAPPSHEEAGWRRQPQ